MTGTSCFHILHLAFRTLPCLCFSNRLCCCSLPVRCPRVSRDAVCLRRQPARSRPAPERLSSRAAPLLAAVRPNVLLVTIDTLRADHVGCYGTRRPPRRRSTRWPRAACASRPRCACAADRPVARVDPDRADAARATASGTTAASRCARRSRRRPRTSGRPATARRPSCPGFPLDRRFGFDRGFDTYDDHLPRGNDRRRTPYVERFADATTDAALMRWLGSAGGPQRPGSCGCTTTIRTRRTSRRPIWPRASATRPYDGEIAFVDRAARTAARRARREAATLARTLVARHADHGESLGEHGEGTHGVFVYDATLRVPWIMAGPRHRRRTRVADGRPLDRRPADACSTTPALRASPELDGRSLRPAADGRAMARRAGLRRVALSASSSWGGRRSTRGGRRRSKFIDAPRAELYDLEQDASRRSNPAAERAAAQPTMAAALETALLTPAPPTAAARRSIPRPRSGCGARLRERRARLATARGRRFAIRRTAFACCHASIAACRRRGSSRTSPSRADRGARRGSWPADGAPHARRRVRGRRTPRSRRSPTSACSRSKASSPPEDAVVLGDNLRFAGRLEEAALFSSAPRARTPRSCSRWCRWPKCASRSASTTTPRRYASACCKLVPDQIEALRRLGDLALLREDLGAAGCTLQPHPRARRRRRGRR